MNIKSLIIVILFSGLVGTVIFFGGQYLTKNNNHTTNPEVTETNTKQTLAPTPKPTATSQPTPSKPPINESSNLSEEAKKLTPRDFSEDYEELKESARSN